MKKYITRLFVSALMIAGVVALPLLAADTALASTTTTACEGVSAAGGSGCGDVEFKTFLGKIVDILIFIIGAISVIMIVVGGLRYTLSGGDANSITAGKNTVIYAIIGLVVALMSYAISKFVISSLQ